MKKKYKRIAAAVIAVICVAVWGVAAMKPISVGAEQVARGDLMRTFTVQAEAVPAYSMVLNAPAAGMVSEIPVKAGMEVQRGEILLKTDTSQEINTDLQREQLKQQLANARQQFERMYGTNGEAQSALASAESQYQLANKNYENGKILTAEGSMAQAELEVLKNIREVAYQQYIQAKENMSEGRKAYYQDQITSYERQLEAAEEAVSPGTVTMPFPGTLWEVFVEEGAYLIQNQPVMKVYASGDMKLEATVLAEDAAFLEPGMMTEVIYPDGSRGEAEITFIARTASKEISSIGIEERRCRIELTGGDMPQSLGAGQQTDISVPIVKAASVLTIPSAALVPYELENRVYIVKDKKAEMVTVEAGASEGGRVEIVSGLSEGDVVITDPYEAGIKNGSRIQINP